MPATFGKHLVILDTDIGTDVDDAFALALLADAPGVTLHGVTTVYGDVLLRARLVARMLRLLGMHARVVPGAPRPLSGLEIWLAGHEGDGYDHLEAEQVDETVSAADFLVDETRKHPGEIEIVAIGPLTNIAEAIERDPGFAGRVRHLWVMGGRFDGDSEAEHNFRCDAVAASRVVGAGIPMTFAGVDVTRTVRLGEQDLLRIGGTGPFGAVLERDTRAWMARWGEDFEVPHDAVAVLAMLRPELFESENVRVRVDSDGANPGQARLERSREVPTAIITRLDPIAVAREVVARVCSASKGGLPVG